MDEEIQKREMSIEKITPRFTLGEIHFGDMAIPRKPVAAMDWWSEKVCHILQGLYTFVPSEFDAAFKWYRYAAEQGEAYAQTILGLMYQCEQDVQFAAVVKWFTLAAEQGVPKAQYNIGRLYYRGKGVPRDYAAAAKWYTRAAEQGLAEAQSELGRMYSHGWGVPQDNEAAVKWFTLAVQQGRADAPRGLGWLYLKGKGVPRDLVRAYMWFNVAESFDDYNYAMFWVSEDEITKDMTPAEIKEAKKLARDWMKKYRSMK